MHEKMDGAPFLITAYYSAWMEAIIYSTTFTLSMSLCKINLKNVYSTLSYALWRSSFKIIVYLQWFLIICNASCVIATTSCICLLLRKLNCASLRDTSIAYLNWFSKSTCTQCFFLQGQVIYYKTTFGGQGPSTCEEGR